MGKHIFISYSSKDANVANKMVAYLESQGCTCWIAPRDIASSEDYTDQINEAIKSCHSLLLIVSDKSIRSQWVKKELTIAVSYNKRIIPFKIQDVTLSGGLEFMLINLQWIDASSNTTSHFHEIIEGLGGLSTSTPSTTNNTTENPHKKRFLIISIAATLCIALSIIIITAPWNNNENILIEEADSIVADSASDKMEAITSNVDSTDVQHEETSSSGKETKKEIDKSKKNSDDKPTAKVGPTTGNSPDRDSDAQNASQTDCDNATLQYKATYDNLTKRLSRVDKIKEYKKNFKENPNDIALLYQINDTKEELRDLVKQFEELQKQNPNDNNVKSSINECKRYLKELENITNNK